MEEEKYIYSYNGINTQNTPYYIVSQAYGNNVSQSIYSQQHSLRNDNPKSSPVNVTIGYRKPVIKRKRLITNDGCKLYIILSLTILTLIGLGTGLYFGFSFKQDKKVNIETTTEINFSQSDTIDGNIPLQTLLFTESQKISSSRDSELSTSIAWTSEGKTSKESFSKISSYVSSVTDKIKFENVTIRADDEATKHREETSSLFTTNPPQISDKTTETSTVPDKITPISNTIWTRLTKKEDFTSKQPATTKDEDKQTTLSSRASTFPIKTSDMIPSNSLPVTKINYSQDNLTKKPFKGISTTRNAIENTSVRQTFPIDLTDSTSNPRETKKQSVTTDDGFNTKSTSITLEARQTDKTNRVSTVSFETQTKMAVTVTKSIKLSTMELLLANLTTGPTDRGEASTAKLQTTTFTPIINNCESLNVIAPRIIGGSNTVLGEIPWQAFLKINRVGMVSRCGAAIIHERYLITAAHCVEKQPFRVTAIMGTANIKSPEKVEVLCTDYYIHPNYSSLNSEYKNDIAVLRLDTVLSFDWKLGPICFPQRDYSEDISYECNSSGYGRIRINDDKVSDILRKSYQIIVPVDECKKHFLNDGSRVTSPDMICSRDKYKKDSGTCNGDSGGPLSCFIDGQWRVLGITSWGRKNCSDGFTVYSRVWTFRNWINTVIKLTNN
ncbi:DgyrCDS787 [Dimorphilus gyrociliatus]|uniref:DgyrCDS787 n=1 Tax=Dimorphilus gyrociliatus TaxID=2664684 RepID=A0A7I8V879_9ANNE|nr:DgyrCDS787 [Dimorphilus gyrociliatus]